MEHLLYIMYHEMQPLTSSERQTERAMHNDEYSDRGEYWVQQQVQANI